MYVGLGGGAAVEWGVRIDEKQFGKCCPGTNIPLMCFRGGMRSRSGGGNAG